MYKLMHSSPACMMQLYYIDVLVVYFIVGPIIQAGHVYICDLKIMDGLPCQKGYYCSAPLCLLYVNRSDQLVPIAIQLKQQPGGDNPIFLPSDNWADWTLAKMYYQSAHFQVRRAHRGSHYIIANNAIYSLWSWCSYTCFQDRHMCRSICMASTHHK